MIKPWLWFSPRWAHALSPLYFRIVGLFSDRTPPTWHSFHWRNIQFQNPLGLAGGADKNAEFLEAWPKMGCGFAEIGTVTPLFQDPNPGKILDRDLETMALWNRMGFPSAGAQEVLANLKNSAPFAIPIFVNIGKNRHTPNENAIEDYLSLIHSLAEFADAFVVNISSPNTLGLRDLQNSAFLIDLLPPLVSAAKKYQRPLLLKLSPDLNEADLKETLLLSVEKGVDGFVLTNTTLDRDTNSPFPPVGGVSGQPLKEKSLLILRQTLQILGERRRGLLIVSVGGIMKPEDVFERLRLGADLVEVYSALVLKGPGFFHHVAGKASPP